MIKSWISTAVAVVASSLCLAMAQQPANSDKAPSAAPKPPQHQQPSSMAADDIHQRYARAQLQLAEANLRRVEQSNHRVAGSVPGSIVAEYQRDVQVAKARWEETIAGEAGSEFRVWLQRAKAEQFATESILENAMAVNKRVPKSFSTLDLERFRLRAEVARLQFERGESLLDASPETQLQWKLDLIDSQVQRLKEESRRSTSFVQYYPSWRW